MVTLKDPSHREIRRALYAAGLESLNVVSGVPFEFISGRIRVEVTVDAPYDPADMPQLRPKENLK